jgi:two-component system OmpR family sensor kinase
VPIRWRLTLWFSVIVLSILAATSVLVYFFVGRYLLDDADNNLGSYAARVHGSILPAKIDGPIDYSVVHSQLPAINEFGSPGIYVQIVDDTGAVVVKSDSLLQVNRALPTSAMLTNDALQGKAEFETLAASDGTRLRVLATPLYVQDKTLVLEVAQSLNVMDSTMNRLRLSLMGGVLLAVVLVAIAGGVILTRAFQPVRRISSIARDIQESADLSRRVGQTKTADEIGQLSSTFDHMIERLESVFESQKNFVADASHELRSPLAVIRGNLDLIKKHPDKENMAESLKAIESETVRMSKIVSDLLLLAELETGQETKKGPVKLAEAVREEVSRTRALAPTRNVEIARAEDISIEGDGQRVRQLLSNLLDNALKHTPESSAVTVSLYREGELARLDVSDTGPGIPPEHMPHLFDRFYRVDKARSRSMGSHGLGLAIVKGIVEQHGGTVSVASEIGKGTTFTVRLRT